MTDQIEIRLRSTLRSAVLPAAPDSLRAFVHDLPAATAPRPAWRLSPLLLAAMVGLLMLATLSAFYVATQLPTPSPEPSVSPSPTRTAFHDLLADFRMDDVVVDRSEGLPGESISDDRTTKTVDLGTIELAGPFVAAVTCRGPGLLTLELWHVTQLAVPTGAQATSGRATVVQWQTPCNGAVELDTLPVGRSEPESQANVEITIARGASWRVAIATYPEAIARPPLDFGSPRQTDGWHFLADYVPDSLATRLSPAAVTVNVPSGATRLGVVAWCDGEGGVTVTANSTDQRVSCPTVRVGERVEFAVPSGGTYTVRATPDNAAWVRLLLETDAEFVSAYPSAPPLPDAVADAVYASVQMATPGTTHGRVAVGRIGSNTQAVIEVSGLPVQATARGNFVAVPVTDGEANHWIEVWTIEPLDFVTAIGERSGAITQAFLDATHGRVYYLAWPEEADGVELRSTRLDGTDDRLLASYASHAWNVAAALAADDSVLVVAGCRGGEHCALTVVDTAELTTSESPIAGAWAGCDPIGVAGGTYLAHCFSDTGDQTIVGNVDGSDQRPITGPLPGAIVDTQAGPVLVFTEGTTPDGGSWAARDLTSGVDTTVWSFERDDLEANLWPAPVALPRDWVLFASELGDFPETEMFARPIPRLVNVRSGEVILLENLPHTTAPEG